MPTNADYTIVQNTKVTFPGANGDIDYTYPLFSAPALNPGFAGLLTFRVNPNATAATLQVELNDMILMTWNFGSDGAARSWQTVVPANLLKAAGNKLTISRPSGTGEISVSDVAMFFKANI